MGLRLSLRLRLLLLTLAALQQPERFDRLMQTYRSWPFVLAEWVLADHGTFVVHVFHQDARQYYELERLWSDVPQVAWEDPDLPTAAALGGTR